MLYYDKSKSILEFDKILEIVSNISPIASAAEKIKNIIPSSDVVIVKRLLAETKKAKEFITVKSMPPFGRAKDITAAADRAVKGAVLTTRELLDIASLLRTTSYLKRYPSSNDDLDALADYFNALNEVNHLEKEISFAVIGEDAISDNASTNLSNIRRDIRKCESNVKDNLNKYTTGSFSKYLQENIVTMRNGRYVVPVKSEYKNEIKGLVHDSSSSGATLFIEPIAVLEQNNRLRELKGAEADEIERILSALSAKVAGFSETIIRNFYAITDLAIIFSKAEFSFRIKGTAPKINEKDNQYKLIAARHPLIDKDKVIPISIDFGGKNNVLVITGPNTGGKTVTLKTLGLFALMMQSGFDIPANDGCIMPVFDAVLPDIGDEQSIEQSLSTFSSHMVNIVGILDNTSSRSLCLFDELGAGTDPTEGAALAISILDEVKNRGAVVAATTHYAELKSYALDTQGVLNASCEFDIETLKPTYRLITGLPGKSNAFAISMRLGIPEKIIERAKNVMSEENIKFEDVLSRLEETENKLSKEKEYTEKVKSEADSILKEAKRMKESVDIEIQTKLEKAQEQANRMLASAKASSDYIFDEINELKRKAEKEKNFDELERARQEIRKSLKNADVGIPEDLSFDNDEYNPPRAFSLGDEVRIKGMNVTGKITDIKDEYAHIQAGIVKTKVLLKDLRLIEIKTEKKQKSSSSFSKSGESTRNELDIRGETGDDSFFAIDRFLESAIINKHETVTIIHGKGTGALKAAVWQHLKNDKRVKSFRSGRYGEGDTGVTVVELK
ncbi:endonuclease MutS2 [Eubacteriales bacterium OttesenSCG-928-G02]|nr:endonuclease MutS2 [Eubacteriales bacterium OttesenSCG-928-G02]